LLGWIEAVGLALFGSLTHLALVCYEARQVPGRWEIFGHLALGPVSGFLFKLAAFPNHLNVFFAGFFAIDFIRMLARVYKPREEEAESPQVVQDVVERVLEYTKEEFERKFKA